MDNCNKTLRKLFIKGIIDKETLIAKMEERNNITEYEKNVNKAILEVMDGGYVKKAVERIWKEKNK
jgi:hypothetical protein